MEAHLRGYGHYFPENGPGDHKEGQYSGREDMGEKDLSARYKEIDFTGMP
jgi:hypothetical protein